VPRAVREKRSSPPAQFCCESASLSLSLTHTPWGPHAIDARECVVLVGRRTLIINCRQPSLSPTLHANDESSREIETGAVKNEARRCIMHQHVSTCSISIGQWRWRRAPGRWESMQPAPHVCSAISLRYLFYNHLPYITLKIEILPHKTKSAF
jgi:hypothetical protein